MLDGGAGTPRSLPGGASTWRREAVANDTRHMAKEEGSNAEQQPKMPALVASMAALITARPLRRDDSFSNRIGHSRTQRIQFQLIRTC